LCNDVEICSSWLCHAALVGSMMVVKVKEVLVSLGIVYYY
jgi:hypothetical protein